jgi:hypothetical protein
MQDIVGELTLGGWGSKMKWGNGFTIPAEYVDPIMQAAIFRLTMYPRRMHLSSTGGVGGLSFWLEYKDTAHNCLRGV